METFIVVLVLIFLVVLGFVLEAIDERKYIKRRKELLKVGRTIVWYACINKEFDDWKEICSAEIVDCRDEYFKIRYSSGDYEYVKYTFFGNYDDKVEVYDGNDLIFSTGFELCDTYHQKD